LIGPYRMLFTYSRYFQCSFVLGALLDSSWERSSEDNPRAL
jgi:hypothetical protein